MNARVTLQDIAVQAGVHRTTVSLALRNSPSLPVETRRRLQDLAAKMGYRPDLALSGLMAYRKAAVPRKAPPPLAFVTGWPTKWAWKHASSHAEYFAGASEKAEEIGYRLEHFWLGERNLTHARMSEILFSRGITGVILAAQLPETSSAVRFEWHRFSAVKIGHFPKQPELHRVKNDDCAAMRLALRKALDAGYRRIGCVFPQWWDQHADLAWSTGFMMERQSIPASDRIPSLLFSQTPDFSKPGAVEQPEPIPAKQLGKWISQHAPEVVVTQEKFIALALAELGLSVPRDLALIDLVSPQEGKISGVRPNSKRVGELAVEILAGQLHQHMYGVPLYPTATLVEGTWIDGDSLPPRAARVEIAAATKDGPSTT